MPFTGLLLLEAALAAALLSHFGVPPCVVQREPTPVQSEELQHLPFESWQNLVFPSCMNAYEVQGAQAASPLVGGGVGVPLNIFWQLLAGQYGGTWLQLLLHHASLPADAPIHLYF